MALNPRETGAALRSALRDRFPSVRFSVRMARGTAYGWLDATWTDGPTEADVRTVTAQFQSARWDGYNERYEQTGNTGYSCEGIITQRNYSPEAQAWAAEQVAKHPDRWASPYDHDGDTYYGRHALLRDTDLTKIPGASA